MSGVVRVGGLREGEHARVRGIVRRAGELLAGADGARGCVYRESRGGLASEGAGRGVDFWLEDASGRVLVRGEHVEVDARAERRKRVLGQVDRDITAVATRARAVKDALREGRGDAKALHAERRRLAELATLLCAVRAHARGRVHLGGSLAAQHAWITAHAKAEQDAHGTAAAASLALVVDEWQVVIEEGDEVEVEGVCAREPAPAGHASGYREQATCLVLRGPDGGAVRITAAATERRSSGTRAKGEPRTAPSSHRTTSAPDARSTSGVAASPSPVERAVIVTVTALCGIGTLLAWWMTR